LQGPNERHIEETAKKGAQALTDEKKRAQALMNSESSTGSK
jgi:hypothetical protein